ncbi:MAG: M48 family metalloprotease [Rhodocyclales bacterium]|nr:M48 family metalloprotease [Rhodocyclales bacterium]
MKRRRLLLAGAACCAGACASSAWANALGYAAPERLDRPDVATDEGGLWAMMDREERNLRRSPLLMKDPQLKAYVQEIACRLGGGHCPDIRVHLVRTPLFNASMAPNGMMQIWSGLLLRAENEAQLAAVIGHEIGHYLQRHSVERLRDIKAKSAFGQFIGLFGVVGAVGQLALLASAFAYSRDHEREADRIGAVLMHQAGYDVAESAKVWGNLLDEARARLGKEPEQSSPLFATHPSSPERRETLGEYAASLPGGNTGEEAFVRHTEPFLEEWLQDEVKRGQYAESLVLFSRMLERRRAVPLVQFHRGEAYRLRGESGDQERAMEDYRAAAAAPNPPPPAFRGIGLIARQRGQGDEALQAFSRYLELSPDAPDSGFIRNYMSELKS